MSLMIKFEESTTDVCTYQNSLGFPSGLGTAVATAGGAQTHQNYSSAEKAALLGESRSARKKWNLPKNSNDVIQTSQSPQRELVNSLVSPIVTNVTSPLAGIGLSSFRREHSRRSVDGNVRLSQGSNTHRYARPSLGMEELVEPTDEGTEEFEIPDSQSKIGLNSASGGAKGINSFNNSVISLR